MAAPAQSEEDVAPNDLQRMVAGRMLMRAAQRSQFPKDQLKTLYDEQVKNAKTVRELVSTTHALLKRLS